MSDEIARQIGAIGAHLDNFGQRMAGIERSVAGVDAKTDRVREELAELRGERRAEKMSDRKRQSGALALGGGVGAVLAGAGHYVLTKIGILPPS